MRKIFAAVSAILALAACAYCAEEKDPVNRSPFSFIQGFVMGDDYVRYQSDVQKIEDSYRKGEITKEKRDEMRADADAKYKAKEYR
jgi:hypothetical protein